ncbi:MAG TPA: hypothetical protein VHB50_16600 [Bryobacteraceae bacterium]|nr:hypothetical protein [Bryobacteraceae bacterium]
MAKNSKIQNGLAESGLNIPPADNAGEVPSVYANTIEMLSMNHIDVRIAFNEVVVETGNAVRNVRRANVVMPVPSFLNLVQIVTANAERLMAASRQQAEQAQAVLTASLNPSQK